MIPIYNCASYIEETLRSVLAQDLGKEVMQIQVVDDASTDIDVRGLVARVGGGRIEYYRQPKNVGSLRNFETCINRSRGHLIHLLHADDRVEAGFYEWMTQLFAKYPEAGAAFCRYASIDASGNRIGIPPALAENDGILTDWLVRIAQQQSVQYASMAVRRAVYEHIGSFYGTSYGEDWEMWVRIARYYPVAYTPKVLAEYRSRTHSITWEKARTSSLVPDLIDVMERIQHHLPAPDRQEAARVARKNWAHSVIYGAYSVYKETKDTHWAQTQLRQSLQLSTHPSVYFGILKFFAKVLVQAS